MCHLASMAAAALVLWVTKSCGSAEGSRMSKAKPSRRPRRGHETEWEQQFVAHKSQFLQHQGGLGLT